MIAVTSFILLTRSTNAQQVTDAQAQALIQALTMQETGGVAPTDAQKQMLLQYIMLKQGSATALNGLSAVQAQALSQRQVAGKPALSGGASSLLAQAPGGATTIPAGSVVLGEKKAGVIRIGIVMPKSQLGQEAQGPSAGEPLRAMLVQYLAGPSVETISITALLPEQIEAESKSKLCDYLVFSSISQKKATGGFGMLKNASSIANMIPMVGMMNGMAGAVAAITAASAATQAATMSSAIKAKSEVTLEYHVTPTGNPSPVLSNSLKAKATADGEDLVTSLVAQEAAAIMTEVSKKR
jgi:hypothetical protein